MNSDENGINSKFAKLGAISDPPAHGGYQEYVYLVNGCVQYFIVWVVSFSTILFCNQHLTNMVSQGRSSKSYTLLNSRCISFMFEFCLQSSYPSKMNLKYLKDTIQKSKTYLSSRTKIQWLFIISLVTGWGLMCSFYFFRCVCLNRINNSSMLTSVYSI